MPEDVETSHMSNFLFFLLKFSFSMSCTVVVYTHEGVLLAYFVAKKGKKNGISILSMPDVCMCALMHLFCIILSY